MADSLYAFDQASADELSNGFQTLGGFSQQIVAAGNAINAPDLGPWHIQWDCCTKDGWIFGCLETTTCWQDVDFSAVRVPLQGVIQGAEAHSQTFLQALSPLHGWVSERVPATTAKFEDLQSALAAVPQGSPATDDQRRTIVNAFNTLKAGLADGQHDLDDLVSAVGQYINDQDGWQTQIDSTRTSMEASVNDALNRLQETARQSPCPGDGDDQFNQRKAMFQQTVDTINAAVNQLASQTRAADDALALVIGTVSNFANSYGVAVQQLDEARGDDFNAALEQLHFDVSLGSWSQLATSATQQLAPLGLMGEYVTQMLLNVQLVR